jgi:hypothetical protein
MIVKILSLAESIFLKTVSKDTASDLSRHSGGSRNPAFSGIGWTPACAGVTIEEAFWTCSYT